MASQQPHNHNKAAISLKPWLVGLCCMLPTLLPSVTYAKKAVAPPAETTEIRQMIGNAEGSCTGQTTSPAKLTLPIGKSTLINLPETLASRSIGDPGVLQSKLISAKTLYLLGTNVGATNMIIQGKSGSCTIIDVVVTLDPDALQQTLAALIPDEKNIKVTAALDSLILSGNVEDAITANRVVDIAQAYVRRQVFPVNANADAANMQQNQQQQQQQGQQQRQNQNSDMVNPRIINMLSVSAQQQVMLEVKVAEISKTLLDQMGAQGLFGGDKFKLLTPFFATDTALFAALGIAPFQTVSGLVSQTLGSVTVDGTTFEPVRVISGGTQSLAGGRAPIYPNGPTIGSTSGKGVSIDAEKRDGLVKILAEPSIMAISGQEGSFLAGGTIFIPVAQNNNNGANTITLEEKEFGVGVKFTPTVLAGGRINLKVAPEVSELNREGVGITSTGITATAVLPAFNVRKASTTVQLMDGQSFAIGGLIKNNTTTNIRAFPILGEIPILGALFRSTEFQKDKTELIFVVTPRLVKPLAANDVRLPTDRYTDPSRTDLFLKGKMEGPAPAELPPGPAPTSPDQLNSQPSAVKPKAPAPANTGFDVK